MSIHQSNLKFTETLKKRSETNYIIIHHTEVRGRHDVKEVHQWHLDKGWAGIGYHYYIDKDGQIRYFSTGYKIGVIEQILKAARR